MISELRIRNFAIIDTLDLAFQHGLHVFTGETGAGKSIIIDALGLLCGGRAAADLIRTGCDDAVVEARMEPPDCSRTEQRLKALGIEPLSDRAVLLRRVIARGDRNRVSVNGQMATVTQLSDVCGGLIAIHGQHDQYALRSPAEQLDLLDRYGSLQAVREQYLALYRRYRAAEAVRAQCDAAQRESRQRTELLEFQGKELDGAGLRADEEETLGEEAARLRHAAQLSSAAEESYRLLYEEEPAALSQLATTQKLAAKIAQIDSTMEPVSAMLESMIIQGREAARLLRDYKASVADDPARLAEIDDRLALISRLKKKYACPTVADLLARAEAVKKELENMVHQGERLSAVTDELSDLSGQMRRCADELSTARQKAAQQFQRRVQQELAQLKMASATCVWHCAPLGESGYRDDGWDDVELLVAANPGEELKPLRKVASGGELSRVMLSIMTVLGQADRVPTLVFDEVDSGIGGAVAEMVGRRLKTLSRARQVFCITHLPQIAAFADRHYRVEKTARKGRTVTTVRLLDRAERVSELARMVGGTSVTATTRRHAEELLVAGERGGE
ncbi:MAG TPA: DNA repair protein RecN [Nitrospiria bacterium]|nr:DNA repair protein RecN [Nitrospiria bacterium]